jgi:adenine-specific DNA-methyltransferase
MTTNKHINNLFNGDCFDLLKELDNESVDLVVSSPPYNIGKSYERRVSLDEYLKNQEAVLKECYRVLKPTGSIFWQVGTYVKNDGGHVPLDAKFFNILDSFGMSMRNRIVWVRSCGLPATKRFSCRHETILWFVKNAQNYKFNLDPIKVPQKYPDKKAWKGDRKGELACDPIGKNPGDVWAFRNVKSGHEERTIHPCQFPEDMIERIVLSTTEVGDVVLDPYMGTGTVAVVAKNFGRNYIGAELDEEYHRIAQLRISGQPDENGVFVNLKTLRAYAEKHGLKDASNLKFQTQTGKCPTLKAKDFDEQQYLSEFISCLEDEADNPAFKRMPKLIK